MNDVFIQSIYVHSVRNITDFEIKLSDTERQHLIITGKNGSGKTSLLEALNKCCHEPDTRSICGYKNIGEMNSFNPSKPSNVHTIVLIEKTIEFKLNIDLRIFEKKYSNKYIMFFFEARRKPELKTPNGIEKINLNVDFLEKKELDTNFIQYIVNLKAERSFAKDDNDLNAVKKIDEWFEYFENRLKELFDAPDLQLIFDRKNYNFQIKIGNQEPFDFTQLSDGYSAVMSIVTELILRMEATGSQAYDVQGIVLIDEIETHLHVALQKNILPFLCDFFPKIQFIVTTHSPFVLSSVSNAVICDLQEKTVITDLSAYSYQTLVESYFDTDQYSSEVKEKIARFEQLTMQNKLSETEEDEYYELKRYFKDAPKFYSKELELKLLQIADLKRTPKAV